MAIKGSVRKRGENYYYRIDLGMVDGKRCQFERVAGPDEDEAYAKMRQAITQLDQGNKAIFEPSQRPFADYLAEWMKKYVLPELAENTYMAYKSDIDNHIKDSIGRYRLNQLTPEAIDDFIKEKFKNCSKSATNRFLAIIKGSLEYACYPLHLLKENPSKHIHLPRGRKYQKRKREVKAFTDEQLIVVLNRYSYGHQFWMPIMTALALGGRSGEVRALRDRDFVDAEKHLVHIEHSLNDKKKNNVHLGPTKTLTSDRIIDYPAEFDRILKLNDAWRKKNRLLMGEFYNQTEFLCTMPDGSPVTYNDLRDFNDWCKREFGDDCCLSFNSLRHYHATKLLASGIPLKDVSVRLGHSKPTTTLNNYADITPITSSLGREVINQVLLNSDRNKFAHKNNDCGQTVGKIVG